ncbi:TipAS antibiotic-recognition domain-containing protein [Paenibacillus sp. YAF4_2]|uniref:TipAS antibiotic-recognition domain-containing protein n=1 Tax=Paenibacillus sp. YAF4_2 TaxID=3233085 RepID=UPI003F9557BB
MDNKQLFAGFHNEEQWNEALHDQNNHLQETYGIEPFEIKEAEVPSMNEQALEAMTFMNEIADCLKSGVKHHDSRVRTLICNHLAFMKEHGHSISAEDYVVQTRFFLSDDFHLAMLEGKQTGLAYYLAAAAEAYIES